MTLDGSLSGHRMIGNWEFHPIKPEDIKLYSQYIQATEYPANLWSSNFAYLWASSQSNLRKVVWKIIDGLLVTFGHSYKDTLYLFCLPFGPGNPEKITKVVFQCLSYCNDWNHGEKNRTLIRMINQSQLEFLQLNPEFDHLFRRVTLQGIERHLDVHKLATLTGKDFSVIRNKINKFHRENQTAVIRKYRKTDLNKLLEVGKYWDSVAGRKYGNIFDKTYYRELILHCGELNQIILVMEEGEQIIGMVSGGELPTGQAWGSLLKYKAGIPGLSELLSIEFIREIQRINPAITLINIGSDLGPGGLRDYKLKFRPVLNLKRYQLYLK